MATLTEVQTTAASTSSKDKDTDERQYAKLRLAGGNGVVERDVLLTPIRNASPSEIPIIDVSGIFSPSLSDRQHVANQVLAAATNNGFFYIKNHGIDPSIPLTTHSALLDFFHQDIETKTRAHVSKSKYFNGYKPSGLQRINATESVDVRETFSWTYDPNYDPIVADVSAIPPHIMTYLRPEEFHWNATSNLPHFKPAIVAYWRACLHLARQLIHTFALALSLPEDYFDPKFSHPDAALALNYYPPISKPATPSAHDEVSIGSHTDFQLFTLLHQSASPLPSLQVLTPTGQWLYAPPIEGTFVVNFGDFFERITNGRFKSTVHRAQNYSGIERISMPFFFGFNRNEQCGVLDCCVDPAAEWVGEGGKGRKFGVVGCDEWVKRRVAGMHRMNEKKS